MFVKVNFAFSVKNSVTAPEFAWLFAAVVNLSRSALTVEGTKILEVTTGITAMFALFTTNAARAEQRVAILLRPACFQEKHGRNGRRLPPLAASSSAMLSLWTSRWWIPRSRRFVKCLLRDCETCVFLQPLPATVQTSGSTNHSPVVYGIPILTKIKWIESNPLLFGQCDRRHSVESLCFVNTESVVVDSVNNALHRLFPARVRLDQVFYI